MSVPKDAKSSADKGRDTVPSPFTLAEAKEFATKVASLNPFTLPLKNVRTNIGNGFIAVEETSSAGGRLTYLKVWDGQDEFAPKIDLMWLTKWQPIQIGMSASRALELLGVLEKMAEEEE